MYFAIEQCYIESYMASASHQCQVQVPMEKLLDCIWDFNRYAQFLSTVKRSRVLSSSDEIAEVEQEVDIIKKINYQIKAHKLLSSDGNQAEVRWSLVKGDFFKKNNGEWILKKTSQDLTHVTYKVELEFNISVPSLILGGIIKKTLPLNVEEFSKEAKKR